MPATSAKQKRAMEAAAHGHSALGIPQSVGKEFVGDEGAQQAAGVVFVAPDGRVLLLQRSPTEENFASHWALPGGKADGDETPEQAAARECGEEIGREPGSLKLLARRGTPNGMVFSTYASPVEEAFAPTLNGEHSGYAWTALDRLPQPLHPAVAETLGSHIGVANDMTPEDWDGLRQGFAKWTREEEAEAEHAADEAITDSVGRKHYDRIPISKVAVNGYKGSEIPKWRSLGLEPDRIYQMLRDPEELAKAAPTFNGIQLLYVHVPVTPGDHRPDEIVGTTGTSAEFEHPYLYNGMSVWAQHALDGIDDKSRHELSSSYAWDADMTPGTFEGNKYDGVMRNLRGNHVAVIPKGRVGPDVALDEAPSAKPPVNKETPMTKKTALQSRTAIRLVAGLSALAMDSALDFAPATKGVTAKNIKTRKAAIVKAVLAMDGIEEALAPATSGGATPDDVILKVLDMIEGQAAAEPMEADEAPMATDPNAGAPPVAAEADDEGGKMPDMAKLKAWLKSKGISDDDMAELDGMMVDPAQDEEDKKDMVSKPAMDAAISAAVKATETRVLNTQREIGAALSHVRPWVGELANDAAINSAEDVYRKALISLEIEGAATMHPGALKAVLDVQPKPGARRATAEPVFAMDSAVSKSLADRYPHAAKISNLG